MSLVVGVDQPDQIAEHHAVFVTQPRARQDHGRKPRVVDMNCKPGRNQFSPAGCKVQWRIETGTQIEARRSGGGIRWQRKFLADARI